VGRQHASHVRDSEKHSNASQHRQRRTAGHGYESDIGYRSDLGGYNSSRLGPHRTAAYPNPSVYCADFTSGDWHYGSDRDVHRQKAPSSSFIAQSGRNIPPYERNVRETIAEEVVDFEGQPGEQRQLLHGQGWPSSVHYPVHNQFTNQYGVNQNVAYPYEADRKRNKSSRRRKFEPIEL